MIVKKKIEKVLKKSLILSKKDYKIAKDTFEAIDKKKWQTALKLSKKARNRILYNLVSYLHLIQPSNLASFYDYQIFIRQNPDYPRINRLRYLAEHKINLKTNSPKNILKWFDGNVPLSDFGKIKLGEIYINQGNIDKGSNLIKGINMEGLRVLGAPYRYSKFYSENGADELIYYDVVASLYGRKSILDIISKTAEKTLKPILVEVEKHVNKTGGVFKFEREESKKTGEG